MSAQTILYVEDEPGDVLVVGNLLPAGSRRIIFPPWPKMVRLRSIICPATAHLQTGKSIHSRRWCCWI